MKDPAAHTNKIQTLGAGRFLRLVSDDGWEFTERIRGSGVVAIVAVTDEGKLVLTEQYRPAVRGRVIDLPAGLAGDGRDGREEPLEQAAQRELLEESGYEAGEMQYLFHGPSSAGMTSEIITLFRAEGLQKTGPGGGDDSEEIEVLEVPLENIDDWIRQQMTAGKQIDPKIFVALYFIEQ